MKLLFKEILMEKFDYVSLLILGAMSGESLLHFSQHACLGAATFVYEYTTTIPSSNLYRPRRLLKGAL
jgi:hypothetical protein